MKWYTPPEVADITGHGLSTVYRWCRERLVPHVRIGGRIMFTSDQIAEIAAAYTVQPEKKLAVDIPNPDYEPAVVVVPMRRTGTEA